MPATTRQRLLVFTLDPRFGGLKWNTTVKQNIKKYSKIFRGMFVQKIPPTQQSTTEYNRVLKDLSRNPCSENTTGTTEYNRVLKDLSGNFGSENTTDTTKYNRIQQSTQRSFEQFLFRNSSIKYLPSLVFISLEHLGLMIPKLTKHVISVLAQNEKLIPQDEGKDLFAPIPNSKKTTSDEILELWDIFKIDQTCHFSADLK